MTGEYELLKKVLRTIEVKEGLDKENIIKKIQEELNNHHLQGEGLNFNQFEIDHCHEVARLPG